MRKPLHHLFFGASLVASVLAQSTPPAPRAAPPPDIKFPALSPPASFSQKVGLGEITVEYSRPNVKGRRVFGGLEPYGAVWRTGANSATKIVFTTPVKIGGKELHAGAYALYSIPDPKEWTVIFNKVTGEWGAYSYEQRNDALRVKVKPVALSELVETFTIDLSDIRADAATLNISWEKTRIPVKLEFDVVSDVVAQINAAMASGAKLPRGVYFGAAQFYFENNLDLKKARVWIEEATKEEAPPFYMLHWKAKILEKLGDKEGARLAAKKSIESAEGAAKEEYIRLNETLIASLK